MNSHDRDNLNFILSRTTPELQAWALDIQNSGNQDEIDYALELMTQAACQVELELLDLIDSDTDQDVGAASKYLQRFCL
jgi:hypothetical protein